MEVAGLGGTWVISEEGAAEADRRWDQGRMGTGAFAGEEVRGREEARSMGGGWAMEACRVGSGGGENGFRMDLVGGAMVGDGGEGTEPVAPPARKGFNERDLHPNQ